MTTVTQCLFFEQYVLKIKTNAFIFTFGTTLWVLAMIFNSLSVMERYPQFYNAVNEAGELRIVDDISKVFDFVRHEGLLFNLQQCRIAGN